MPGSMQRDTRSGMDVMPGMERQLSLRQGEGPVGRWDREVHPLFEGGEFFFFFL